MTVLPPVQKSKSPLIDGDGLVKTVTLIELDPVHPLPSVTVTEYTPAVVALMVGELCPFDHKYAV